jgi:hypothetical protein
MANRTIKVYGHNHAADTALVASWGGVQVFNGTISANVTDFDNHWDTTSDVGPQLELFEFTYNNADDTTESTHALNITVSAGSASIGWIYDISNNDNAIYEGYPSDGKPPVIDIGGKWFWKSGQGESVYHDGTELAAHGMDAVINANTFAVNGTAVELADNAPSGYKFDGFAHHLLTNEVLTCNVRVYKTLVACVGGANWVK